MDKLILVGDYHKPNVKRIIEKADREISRLKEGIEYYPARHPRRELLTWYQTLKKRVWTSALECDGNQASAIYMYSPKRVCCEGYRSTEDIRHYSMMDLFWDFTDKNLLAAVEAQEPRIFGLDNLNPFYLFCKILHENGHDKFLNKIKTPMQRFREVLWTAYLKILGPSVTIIGLNHLKTMKHRLEKAGLEAIIYPSEA